MDKCCRECNELLEHSKAFDLGKLVAYSKNGIVSRTILENRSGTLTVFAFDAGQKLSEHSAPFDAVVQVLDGEGEFKIASKVSKIRKGQLLIMPANVPHAVRAVKKFKMLLTMIKGKK